MVILEVSGQLHSLTALSQEYIPIINCIGSLAGPRSDIDDVQKKTFLGLNETRTDIFIR
jgi:hypothetical protein